MKWILAALVGSFLHACTNHIDNFLVKISGNGELEDLGGVGALVVTSGFFGLVVMLFAFLVTNGNVFSVSATDRLLLILVGAIEIFATLFYLYALEKDDAVTVTGWFNTVPALIMVGGAIFLGESYTVIQAIGVFVVIAAAVALSFDGGSSEMKFNRKLALLMICSALLYTVMYILFKYVVVSEDKFFISIFWQYLGGVVTGLLMFIFSKKYRSGFLYLLKNSGEKVLALNALNEVLFMSGALLSLWATLRTKAFYVALIENFQPFMVLVIGLVISIFVKWYREDQKITIKSVLWNFTTLVIMLIGVLFIIY